MDTHIDFFEEGMKEVLQEAPVECVRSMRQHLEFIKVREPHFKTVDSCLRGLEGTPNMLKLLVAAYVLNGGVPLKYSKSKDPLSCKDHDISEMDKLLREMEEITTDDQK